MNLRNLNCFVDLHLHLDGSLSIGTVKKLAAWQGIPLDMTEEQLKKKLMVSEGCRDLNEYLTKFSFPLELMQTEEALEESVYDLLCRLDRQGMMYCEVRFAPQLHTKKGLSQEQVIEAALKGLKRAEKDFQFIIKAGLILCCMRGAHNEYDNMITVDRTAEYLGRGVCGVDLAGAEALYPTIQYKELFERAKSLKIPITIHAGEAAGAESVAHAVHMGAVRIGHGIHAVYDSSVLDLLKKQNIILELCPTSNLNTRAIEDMVKYPAMELMKSGVKVTVNTDNMTVSDTNIRKEFQLLLNTFSINDNVFRQLLYNAVEAAFTTEEIKKQLRYRIEKELSDTAAGKAEL